MSKWQLYKIRVLSVIYWGRDLLAAGLDKLANILAKNPKKYAKIEIIAWGFTTLLFILILLRG
ncbi:MAG: hypothetical protein MR481_05850 [Campylobacter sp.]|uniref:hypothetical protein n=1 Tax=Campylobacter sp. TaxID=205 RepID=UPI002AA70BF9|nr:hypothetical protein [Campylobacter sp.]MCI7247429.1 hypothetical protein [Campylobacter sp.]